MYLVCASYLVITALFAAIPTVIVSLQIVGHRVVAESSTRYQKSLRLDEVDDSVDSRCSGRAS